MDRAHSVAKGRAVDDAAASTEEMAAAVDPSWMRPMLGLVRRLGACNDLQGTLDCIAEGVVDVLDFQAVAINVRASGDSLRVEAVSGPPELTKLLGGSIAFDEWEALLDSCEGWGSLRFLSHERVQDRFADLPAWTPDGPAPDDPEAWHPGDGLFAPLRLADGSLLGVLSVDLPSSGRRPDAGQRMLLELFAAEATVAVSDAMRQASLEDSRTVFRAVFADAPVAMAILDTRLVVQEVNAAFERLVGRASGTLVGRGFSEIVHVEDVDNVTDWLASLLAERATALTAEHRLVRADGTIRLARSGFTRIDTALDAGRLVANVEDVTDSRAALDELRYLADHDVLTGLPNRRRVLGRLERLLPTASQTSVAAVLYCDVDGFKDVNDGFGHAAGDDLLVQIAERLRRAVRAGDLLCRHGGDEFVIVCGPMFGPAGASSVARRCIGALAEPFPVGSQTVQVALCVGGAVASRPGMSPSELLGAADKALYRAKAAGPGSLWLS